MVATIAVASCHPTVQLPPALIEQNKAAGPAAAAEWVLAEGLRHPPQAGCLAAHRSGAVPPTARG
jgi:hypothetical protein